MFLQQVGPGGNLKDVRYLAVKVFKNSLVFVQELVNVRKEVSPNLNLVLVYLHVV